MQVVLGSIRSLNGVSVNSPGIPIETKNSIPSSRKSVSRGGPATIGKNLERNLNSLVLHSLSESGLDFPHVQYVESQPQGHSERLRANSNTKQQEVIMCRPEDSDKSFALSAMSSELSSGFGPHDIEPALAKNRNRRTQKKNSHRSKLSSGGCCQNRASSEQQQSSTLQTIPKDHPLRKTQHSRREISDRSDDIDVAFQAARGKIDQRTLAILDKTKALLDQTKSKDWKRNKSDRDNALARFRDRYSRPMSGEQQTDSTANDHAASSDDVDESSQIDATERAPDTSKSAAKHDSSALSRDIDIDEAEDADGRADNAATEASCDIELLRPPDKAPDNDNEWENELARQILTIYATSVKAKAATEKDSRVLSPIVRPTRDSSRPQTGALAQPQHTVNGNAACSLPVLNSRKSAPELRTASSRASVHSSWEPSQRLDDGKVVINMPRIPSPIWFAGTGAVKAVWCALTDGYGELHHHPNSSSGAVASSTSMQALTLCKHRLCEEIRRLETQSKFLECIAAIETLLIGLVRARGASDLEIKLWKQLVVTCNAFSSRCIDYKKFSVALKLMKQAEHLIDNSVLVDSAMRMELLAFLYDTYAHYYYRRQKPSAGLQYSVKAHEIHAKQSSWSHVAKSRLHIATLLSFQKKHAEAMQYMTSILELIEANKLEDGGSGASGQKICLVAVCYNNLAVEQLHLRAFDAAGVAADNAQRLAKLCLSYSNRWLVQFDATRQCVALAVATLMEDTNRSS